MRRRESQKQEGEKREEERLKEKREEEEEERLRKEGEERKKREEEEEERKKREEEERLRKEEEERKKREEEEEERTKVQKIKGCRFCDREGTPASFAPKAPKKWTGGAPREVRHGAELVRSWCTECMTMNKQRGRTDVSFVACSTLSGERGCRFCLRRGKPASFAPNAPPDWEGVEVRDGAELVTTWCTMCVTKNRSYTQEDFAAMEDADGMPRKWHQQSCYSDLECPYTASTAPYVSLGQQASGIPASDERVRKHMDNTWHGSDYINIVEHRRVGMESDLRTVPAGGWENYMCDYPAILPLYALQYLQRHDEERLALLGEPRDRWNRGAGDGQGAVLKDIEWSLEFWYPRNSFNAEALSSIVAGIYGTLDLGDIYDRLMLPHGALAEETRYSLRLQEQAIRQNPDVVHGKSMGQWPLPLRLHMQNLCMGLIHPALSDAISLAAEGQFAGPNWTNAIVGLGMRPSAATEPVICEGLNSPGIVDLLACAQEAAKFPDGLLDHRRELMEDLRILIGQSQYLHEHPPRKGPVPADAEGGPVPAEEGGPVPADVRQPWAEGAIPGDWTGWRMSAVKLLEVTQLDCQVVRARRQLMVYCDRARWDRTFEFIYGWDEWKDRPGNITLPFGQRREADGSETQGEHGDATPFQNRKERRNTKQRNRQEERERDIEGERELDRVATRDALRDRQEEEEREMQETEEEEALRRNSSVFCLNTPDAQALSLSIRTQRRESQQQKRKEERERARERERERDSQRERAKEQYLERERVRKAREKEEEEEGRQEAEAEEGRKSKR